jgi:hypothetical protein
MNDTYVVETFGEPIPDLKGSDICEVTLSFLMLRALVHLGKDENEEDRFLEVVFKSIKGFRYLDEGDLLPYWRSGVFDNTHHLVHEIRRGGWAEQEERNGFLNATAAIGLHREWIIASSNGCLNVISTSEPIIRFLGGAGG